MSFPSYPQYQDSGRQWLGQLPKGWRLVPFRSLFRRVKRTDFPEEELLSVYRDYGVIRKRDRDDNFNKASEDLAPYQLVEPGDLAVNKMKAWQGSLGISPYRGIVSPAYFVYRAVHNELPRYLHYLLRSDPYATGFLTISKGIRINQWDVDPDHLAQLPIPLPSPPEQAAIVGLLDRETAKIDALVEEQQRLIELLKEKRQAVISHAVTKGLDPTVPMKESRVEWLGEVPAHWKTAPLKWAVQSIEQGWSPQCESFRVESPEEWGVLKVGCVNGGMFRPEENKALPPELNPMPELGLQRGDILVSRANTRELVGSAALIPEDYSHLMLCDKLYRLRANEAVVLPEFLSTYLQSRISREAFELAATGTSASMVNIGQGTVMNLTVALPSISEQQAIVGLVYDMQQRADNLVRASETAISILEERRAALISAAVTGKIDVRSTAPQRAQAA